MPSKSQKQRRYLEKKKGHDWVKKHHFDKVKSSAGVPVARGSRIKK